MTAATADEAAIEVPDHWQEFVRFNTKWASGQPLPTLCTGRCVLLVRHYDLSSPWSNTAADTSEFSMPEATGTTSEEKVALQWNGVVALGQRYGRAYRNSLSAGDKSLHSWPYRVTLGEWTVRFFTRSAFRDRHTFSCDHYPLHRHGDVPPRHL